MNILFLNSIGITKFGGGEKWMLTAAKGLAERKHQVIVAGKQGGQFLQRAARAGIKTAALTIHGDIGPIATWKIYRFCRKNDIEVMICNLNKDVRVGGLAARLAHVPVVLARHGILLCGKKWKHKFTLTHLTDGIITNSETIKTAYAGYGWFRPDFVKVLYNGIEDKSSVASYDYKNKYPGKKVLLSAGRLAEQKGFSWFIDAAAILSRKRSDLQFVIAGRGDWERRLKEHAKSRGIENNVTFLGYIENIDPYIKGCDLFVLASLFEGMPNVVMEAMALGKAVIATDVNGARELMEDGKTGIFIPPKNAELLALKINSVIDNPALLQRYGQNGLARVRARFTIPAMISNLENHLLEKLNEKKNKKART